MADYLSTLAEASYEGIVFPVSAVSVDGGHDVAEHTAYLRRGADVEPCGLKAYRGSFTVPCVNTAQLMQRYGELAQGLRDRLVDRFEATPIGLLTLPGYRVFTAAVTGWSTRLAPDDRGGAPLEVTFVEHNGTAALLAGPDGSAPAPTTTGVQSAADAADAAVAPYRPAGYARLGVTIREQLALLDAGALAYTAVAAAFRVMLAAVDLYLALPALGAAGAHAATAALLALQAAVYALRGRYQPTLTRQRLFTVPETMALWEIAQIVYKDASQTALLRAANAIPDPLFVPAGRVLTILPLA